MSGAFPEGIPLVVLTLSGVLGLVIGSFLNVVVYRIPLGRSLSTPPSSCPRCGSSIRPWDNVPVLSWLLLNGKCRRCRAGISPRYPLVEAGTGLAFIGVAWHFVTTERLDGVGLAAGLLVTTAFLYLAAVSIALALIDLAVHRLPNVIVLPSYVVGIVLLAVATLISGDVGALLRAGAGLAILWFAYFLLAILYPGGMGFGDVKLAGVLGLYLAYLGWQELFIGAFAAFFLGGAFAVWMLATRRATRKSGIPFGPWMLAGAWVGVLCGASVWQGYLELLGVA